MSRIVVFVLSLSLMGCASLAQIEQENAQRFSSMTLASVNNCTSTKGDEMTEVVTFSSYNCYQAEHGLLRIVWGDYFVRGFKNKKYGTTSYQAYAILYSR